jgi:predicted anti-sigma-YlaC factor YlaD
VFCDEVLELIEPIAAGDVTPEGRLEAHLASCRDCRAALEDARRVEALLRGQPAPVPPPHFTARTMSRLRRERWRSEKAVDLGFNVALAAVAIAVVAGGWLLLRFSGFNVVGPDAIDLIGQGATTLVHRGLSVIPAYAGAAVLLGAALGLWWWAERDART